MVSPKALLRLLQGDYTRNVLGNAGSNAYWNYDPVPSWDNTTGSITLKAAGAKGKQRGRNSRHSHRPL